MAVTPCFGSGKPGLYGAPGELARVPSPSVKVI